MMVIRNEKGLTLLELLAVITISSFVLLGISSVLFSGIQGATKADELNLIREQGNKLMLSLQNQWNSFSFDYVQKVATDNPDDYKYKLLKFDYDLYDKKNATGKVDFIEKQASTKEIATIQYIPATNILLILDETGKMPLFQSKLPTERVQIKEGPDDKGNIVKGVTMTVANIVSTPLALVDKGGNAIENCYQSGVFTINIRLESAEGLSEVYTCNLGF